MIVSFLSLILSPPPSSGLSGAGQNGRRGAEAVPPEVRRGPERELDHQSQLDGPQRGQRQPLLELPRPLHHQGSDVTKTQPRGRACDGRRRGVPRGRGDAHPLPGLKKGIYQQNPKLEQIQPHILSTWRTQPGQPAASLPPHIARHPSSQTPGVFCGITVEDGRCWFCTGTAPDGAHSQRKGTEAATLPTLKMDCPLRGGPAGSRLHFPERFNSLEQT